MEELASRSSLHAQQQGAELEARTQLLSVQHQLERLTHQLAQEQEKGLALTSRVAELSTRLELREGELLEAKQASSLMSEELRGQIRELTTSILRERGEEMVQRSTETLAPLREELKRFSEQVQQSYGAEALQRQSLQTEIRLLVERSLQISQETTSLTQALRGDSKVQGDWGEMILEHILQESGLERGKHYMVQETLRDEEGRVIPSAEGRGGLRPDVIVRFPRQGSIIIDSKVSLKAYADYTISTSDEERKSHAQAHLSSIRRHIRSLSDKGYWRHLDESPSFVMLFIPSEPAYILALREEPNLWSEAYRQGVILINGSNLIAALKMAEDMWQRDQQDRKVVEVLREAEALYEKVRLFVDNFLDAEQKLAKATESLQKAKGQLHQGRGNIIGRMEKLQKLGVKVQKSIPLSSIEEAEGEDD